MGSASSQCAKENRQLVILDQDNGHGEGMEERIDIPCGLMNQLSTNARKNVLDKHTNTVWVNLPTVAL